MERLYGNGKKRQVTRKGGRAREAHDMTPMRHLKLLLTRIPARAAMLAACLLATPVFTTSTPAQSPTEYEVKAVFLYNFAKFVEWPPDPPADVSDPFVIGIVGRDPFGDALEQTLRRKTLNGRPLAIKRFKDRQAARGCRVLFISASERKHLNALLTSLHGDPVLTVGDNESFAKAGGVIAFTLEDNRVRFEINVDAAQRAGLRISSKLLSLAKIVREER
jgi:uncharacterized protein DUF4154